MHAMQNCCKLRCLAGSSVSRAGLAPKRFLQVLSVPTVSCSSSASTGATSRVKPVVSASSVSLTGPIGILVASSLAAAVLLGSPDGSQARAEGLSSKISDKVSSMTSSSTGSSAAAVPLDRLPALPFAADALEPYIDTTTMQIHHDKHHQTYITKLQTALSKAPALENKSLDDLNKAVGTKDIPTEVTTAVRNNGGGHWNHSFFWKVLAPAESKEADYQTAASDELKQAIEDGWGSLKDFQAKFNEAAAAVFGSGWAWLGVDDSGKLVISTTSNQDNPLMKAVVKEANTPVLGLDVWEHAYYLKYQNKRPDYLNSWWHVVNWEQVSHNYEQAKAGKLPSTA